MLPDTASLIACAGLLLAALPVAAQPHPTAEPAPWAPVQGRLMTEWGERVTPDNAWPEYPRPSLVRKDWLNLNGLWRCTIVPEGKSRADGEARRILVPFPPESALSGVGHVVKPDETLWYWRTFRTPREWAGKRVLLHFGAVDWRAVVTVNGTEVGTHEGGYDPFSFDITDALRDGENEVVVMVRDGTDHSGQPRGKQWLTPHGIWYTPTSGIWQTVWLEPVDAVHLARVRCDADPATGAIDIHPELAGPVTPDTVVRIAVERDGNTEAMLECEGTVSNSRIVIADPRAWTPDDPFLYDLKVTIARGDRVLDEASSYFAFRTIAVGPDSRGMNRILLNGEPVFHYGPLDQGFWPDGLYTPPSDDALRFDIEAAKRMGSNMIRKHVKVEPERFYWWCDKLGVMVWQDMPSPFFSGVAPSPDDNRFNNPPLTDEWKAAFEREWREIINDFRHHPSIVMWVPWNEGWGQNDLDWSREMAELTRRLDPTRLVNNASGWTDMGVGHTMDIHIYPGPATPPREPARAAVLGEFGGLGLPVEGHTWVDSNNWGYVSYKTSEEVTRAYLALLEKIPVLIGRGLTAAVYTQTTDVEIEVNGWLTYDRKVWKIDPERVRDATLRLYQPPPLYRAVASTAQDTRDAGERPVTWRSTTADPGPGWESPSFDDSAWQTGPAGFGTKGTPGALVGTEWNTGDIWLRRTFDLADAPRGTLYLSIHHDEDAEVYLNGVRIASLTGYATGYELVPLDDNARAALREGKNVLAVRCRQTRGGQFVDVGLAEEISDHATKNGR